MNREEMLMVLQSVKEPLISLIAFYDGITCEYMTSNGCGGFELLDWSELDTYDYDAPNQEWEDLCDDELEEWVNRLKNGDFSSISSLSSKHDGN